MSTYTQGSDGRVDSVKRISHAVSKEVRNVLHLHAYTLALFNNFFDSPVDIAVIAIIALLLFGKRLPDLAKSLGKSIVEFKKGLSQTTEEIKKSTQMDAPDNVQELPPAKSSPSVGAGASQSNSRHIKQVTSVSEEP